MQVNFHNILINYSTQLNSLKDKYTTDSSQSSNSYMRSDRQRGDYLSALLCMKESDFFINLYRVVESNRLLLERNLDDLHLKERFDMVNVRSRQLK